MICPHCKKEIKPKPRKKDSVRKWRKDSIEMLTAHWITDIIVRNHPALKNKLKISLNRQKAAQAIYECKEKEGYAYSKTFSICRWVCDNEFWKKQFQAVPKLTRNDNGNTGITLKWIQRFENEMRKDSRRTAEDISSHFDFSPAFEGESK